MGYPEWNCDDINEYKYDLIIEDFPVGTYDDATLGLCGSTTLGVTDS